jgi:3',5'-nucleoside bisphosphate phosphatase
MQRVDLHIHSHASDGHYSPGEVVQMAASAKLDVIAITDHDTVAGVQEAIRTADGLAVRVVPGIEISTREGDDEFHILGYFIDPAAPSMQAHQQGAGVRRVERMQGMVRRLQELGVGVEYEDVTRAAGPEASSIGRPHLARALLERGSTRSFAEAFDRYIGDRGPAFVRSDFPGVREAIDSIRAAGGVPVWAHPDVASFDAYVRTFAGWGLSGVECYRPNTPPAESHLFETAAISLGLFRTGGSDWHGSHRGPLGDFAVSYRDVRELLDAYLPN